MQLAGTYSGNCLKKFVVWNCFYRPVTNKEVESENSNSLKEFESSKDEELLLQTGAPTCKSTCI